MTVVLEHQVKTIAAEIIEQFGGNFSRASELSDVEDVVRSVIAQYDISNIPRLEVP
jgi:hypothetical protein